MKRIDYIFVCLVLILVYSCNSNSKELQNVDLLRKPYLQSAIADSITILWRTNVGTTSEVAYKLKEAKKWNYKKGVTRSTNTGSIENEVTLTGLEPNSNYEYQVFTDESQLLKEEILYFPSPVSKQDSTFSFFAVGDIGEAIEDEGTPDQLGRALINFVDSLRFGLLLGDIVYPDGRSEIYDTNLFQHFEKVFPYVPVFTILGNHDWGEEPDENYVKEWKLPGNEHYYSFDYGNIHFIGLDTKQGELYEYDKQVAWLRDDLSNISKDMEWTIVFLHHNGKSCTYKNDYEGVVSLYPIFEEFDVDLVLNGHAHTYERLNPMNGNGEVLITKKDTSTNSYVQTEGFTSITVGSGGILRGLGNDPDPFTPNPEACRYPDLVAAYTHDWVFLKLDIDGNQLTGTAMTTEDLTIVDRFIIQKR
ncbi:MAG: metallophosphoesterase family protein [Bacteroidota bacterium]